MPQYRVKHANQIPRGGGYNLDLPELGIVGQGSTFDLLYARVVEYRKANGHPVGLGLRSEVEQLACASNPDSCEDVDPNVPPRPSRMGIGDVVLGTKVAFNVLLNKAAAAIGVGESPIVSREEAERRAAICAACVYNQPISGVCGSPCGPLKELVRATIGTAKTSRDGELRSCFICKCFLAISVWVDIATQLGPMDDQTRARFKTVKGCWKRLD